MHFVDFGKYRQFKLVLLRSIFISMAWILRLVVLGKEPTALVVQKKTRRDGIKRDIQGHSEVSTRRIDIEVCGAWVQEEVGWTAYKG